MRTTYFQLTARLNALHWRWVNINLLRCRDCPNCQAKNERNRQRQEQGQGQGKLGSYCQAGKSIAITTNSRNGKAIRNENHVLRLCRRLSPCSCIFHIFHFSTLRLFCFFFFECVCVFYSYCSCSSLSLSLSIALLNMFTAISCMKYMSLYGLAWRPTWAIDLGN